MRTLAQKASPLQIILLSSRPCVLVQMPLHIALLVIQSARSDFEQAHAHPWSDFSQLNGLVSRLDEDVVADFDSVFDVLEP